MDNVKFFEGRMVEGGAWRLREREICDEARVIGSLEPVEV